MNPVTPEERDTFWSALSDGLGGSGMSASAMRPPVEPRRGFDFIRLLLSLLSPSSRPTGRTFADDMGRVSEK